MESLFIYIAKSAGLLLLFYSAYYFLLRKETFFNNNRWFLISGLITSAILPFFVYTKIMWIEPTSISGLTEVFIPEVYETKKSGINWNYVVIAFYGIGLLVFLIKFAMDYYSLHSVLRNKKIQQQADFKFVDINENIAPFSYFEYIVYNSSMYTTAELESILEHEKLHSDQNHTIDVLISRVFCVLFWFNPIIWMYKNAIHQNLEFIADNEASKKIADKKAYQYTLLKITTHKNYITITNHFYQSLIKKRIVMLNKNQSNKRNSWKYYTVIPALVGFVFLFQVEVIAKEKPGIENNQSNSRYQTQQSANKNEQILNSISSYTDKEIYIDGSKATEDEMNKLDPNEIVSMDVSKNSGKTIIKIITKKSTKQLNTNDKEIYIDGVKSTSDLLSRLDENKIDRMDVDTDKNTIRITTKTIQQEKPIIIINGVQANSQVNVDDIPSNDIVSINVIKGKSAEDKYGNAGKNGAVEIITKNSTEKNEQPATIKIQKKPGNHVLITSDKLKTKNAEKPLIVIDGKIIDNKNIEDLDPQNIEKMDVLKGISSVTKYGDKGKNGVIEITTKK